VLTRCDGARGPSLLTTRYVRDMYPKGHATDVRLKKGGSHLVQNELLSAFFLTRCDACAKLSLLIGSQLHAFVEPVVCFGSAFRGRIQASIEAMQCAGTRGSSARHSVFGV